MALDIRIMNLRRRDEFLKIPTFIIDRRTFLGNPYFIGNDGTREQVIEKYRLLLPARYDKLSIVKEKIDEILETARKGPIQLACWCSPLPCHGDVIRDFILKLDSSDDSLQT